MIQNNIPDLQTRDFGYAGTGVVEHGEHTPVSPPTPCLRVWRIDDRLRLLPRKKLNSVIELTSDSSDFHSSWASGYAAYVLGFNPENEFEYVSCEWSGG